MLSILVSKGAGYGRRLARIAFSDYTLAAVSAVAEAPTTLPPILGMVNCRSRSQVLALLAFKYRLMT